MTTTAPLPAPAATVPTGPPPDEGQSYRDGPGRLRIDPRVVQKLAARTADEVDGVSHASAGPIGRAVHGPVPAGTPADQLSIDLALAVSVQYPLSLPAVVERLAAHVSRRVEELLGRPVGHIHITIQHLGRPDPADSPRVR